MRRSMHLLICTCLILVTSWPGRAQGPAFVVQLGHSGEVTAAMFSPDGKLIASNGEGGIIIWHSATGRELRRIAGMFSAIDFAPDSKSVVAAETIPDNVDGVEQVREEPFSVATFEVSSGKLIRKFPTHKGKITSVKFSRDGALVLTAGEDMTAKLWEAATGKLRVSFTGHQSMVSSAVFSPDNKFIATASSRIRVPDEGEVWDSTARIWDIKTGKELYRLTHFDQEKVGFTGIGLVQFSPDGKFLITSARQKNIATSEAYTIRVWDWLKRKEVHRFNGCSAVAFSPDGKYFLADIVEKLDDKGFIDSEKLDGIELIELQSGRVVSRFAGFQLWSRIESLSFSPDGKYALAAIGTISSGGSGAGDYGENALRIFDVMTGKQIRDLSQSARQVKQLFLSKDERNLLAGDYLWNLEKGLPVVLGNFKPHALEDELFASWPDRLFSSDGKIMAEMIASEDESGSMSYQLWNLETGRVVRKIETKGGFTVHLPSRHQFLILESEVSVCAWRISDARNVWCVETTHDYSLAVTRWLTQDYGFSAMSSDEKTIFIRNSPDSLIGVDVATGRQLWQTRIKMLPFPRVHVSANNQYVIVPLDKTDETDETNPDDSLSFIDSRSGAEVFKIKVGNYFTLTDLNKVLVTDEKSKNQHRVINKDTGKMFARLTGEIGTPAAISADLKQLLTINVDEIRLYDLSTGKLIRTFEGHNSGVSRATFFRDDNLVISASVDGTTRVWDVGTGRELCSLVSFNDGTWVVTTPDGRFDTNNLESSAGLQWVVPDEPLTPLPVEIFMRDYYEPRLLARVLFGERLPPVRNLSTLNRLQPRIEIKEIREAAAPNTVEVTVAVENVTRAYQGGVNRKAAESGVYDARLFRDGQLVGYSTSDERLRTTFRAYKDFDDELAAWREANKVELGGGKNTFTFNVKLPGNPSNKQVEFSAYAFNDDRVKSETSRVTYTIPADANIKTEPRAAYVIAVGVNKYDNPEWDLRFAGNDSRAILHNVSAGLRAQNEFAEVVEIPLISDSEIVNGKTVEKRDATQGNVQAVLQLLAGKSPSADRLKDLERAVGADIVRKIRQATPADMVVLAFSSHGYADKNGIFYIVPTDIGKDSARQVTDELLNRSISSDELSLWLRGVDAGEMVMIVDACHAATAVEGREFKPGPMGSRGLGQLAYDKGMRVLAASQADDVALEVRRLEHGLLTYALTKEGLEAGTADASRDGRISLQEWLGYGVERVPTLYEEVRAGRVKPFEVLGRDPVPVKTTGAGMSLRQKNAFQQPSLFDFKRSGHNVVLAAVPRGR